MARLDGCELGPECDGLLLELTRILAHRGPDDVRVMREDEVGLAFTRLSLVAPEDGGQPLISPDGSVVLIANGEVYNHRELAATLPAGTKFATKSDCEVLVHLYQRDGLRFLDSVNGMFSLVLWDRTRHRLLLCRDRFGIKPLFYHRNRDRIVFASEIKALFADPATPRRLDWDAALADQGLTVAPAFTEERAISWFEEIELVPAATIIEIDLRDGRTVDHRWWRLPEPLAASDASDDELVARYRELLEVSVRDCVMADAEIGLLLSGGIDSAAVAALSDSPGLHTFTAVVGSTVRNGDAEWGHRTAKALGLPNHQVLFDNTRVPGVEEWKRLLWLSETPQCSPEVFYKHELHRFVRARRPDIKGMLLGAAADEFNGGYTVGYAEGGDWTAFLNNITGMAREHALYRRPALAQWWKFADIPLLTDEVLATNGGPDLSDPYAAYLAWNHRNIQQYNVWHEDRTAAGSSIEARVPFLDHRLVELSVSIPVARRADLLWDKAILRRAMAGVLPDEVLNRPKVPFFHGEGVRHTYRTFVRMMAQEGDALLEEALSSTRAKDYLHADGMRAMLRRLEHDPGSMNVEILLRLINMGLLEEMTASLPAPPSAGPFAPIPEAIEVTDWDAQAVEIEGRTLYVTPAAVTEVFALAEHVALAHVPADGTWYVAVAGSFEYVLDPVEDAAWLGVLRALDGRRDLAGILAEVGGDPEAMLPLVREALELHLIEAVGSAQ